MTVIENTGKIVYPQIIHICDIQMSSRWPVFYSVFAMSVRASKVPSLKHICDDIKNIKPT